MPWGDRTGPLGLGPMTGRGLGYCAGFSTPGYTKGPGLGFGRGFGRGFRWFWRRPFFFSVSRMPLSYEPYFYREPTKEEELNSLKSIAENLEKELKAIRERIKKLEGE